MLLQGGEEDEGEEEGEEGGDREGRYLGVNDFNVTAVSHWIIPYILCWHESLYQQCRCKAGRRRKRGKWRRVGRERGLRTVGTFKGVRTHEE